MMWGKKYHPIGAIMQIGLDCNSKESACFLTSECFHLKTQNHFRVMLSMCLFCLSFKGEMGKRGYSV